MQIVDKVTALNEPLLVNFIDFRKAFDCIHRIAVWKILLDVMAFQKR